MNVTDLPDRIQRKIAVTEAGCWQWTAAVSSKGYGRLYNVWGRDSQKRVARAHRVTYELLVGAIPDGLQLDHLCRNCGCVNPAHLEPVTPVVNTARGQGTAQAGTRARLLTGMCTKGHDDWVRDKRRPESFYCRLCKNEAARRRHKAA